MSVEIRHQMDSKPSKPDTEPPYALFPHVEPIMSHIEREGLGLVPPPSLHDDFTCILELNKLMSSPMTNVQIGDLFRLETQYPATPESHWRLVYTSFDSSEISFLTMNDPASLKVTRFYAKNDPFSSYDFVPFNSGSLYYHVGVMNGP